MTSFVKYGYLTALASMAKLAFRLSGSMPDPEPDSSINIPSQEKGRTIKTNVYSSTTKSTGPSPVVNFHGSGDTVLDASYRLAPKTPFPGAQNDGEDVINYVLANPELYDRNRMVISGFSAGGHTALVLASTIFPADTFSGIILFYPAINLSLDSHTTENPDPEITPAISPTVFSLLIECYIQDPNLDKKDPRISPMFASMDTVPKQMTIVTAGADNLMPDVERWVERLRADGQQSVTYRKFEKCNHAFDMSPKPESIEEKARTEAYSTVVAMLQK